MKKIYLAFALILLLTSSGIRAQLYSGGQDSLLFDGANDITIIPTNNTGDCKIMVTFAYGTIEGTRFITKIYEVCGEYDTSVTAEKGVIHKNDQLKLGEEITTGNDGNLELEFYDGSVIRMGPNSKITITGDMCERKTLVNTAGKIWTSVKKLLGSQKYEVKTEQSIQSPRGTEFSVETTAGGDIIKVYEGTVEVTATGKSLSNKTEVETDAVMKLYEDYQAGKITMEEFIKRSQESRENITKLSDDMKSKMCEAGYKVTVTDKVSDPVPLESGGNWFDDANFKR